MNTRRERGTKTAMSEAELELVHASMTEQQERVRAEQAALQKEREEFQRERDADIKRRAERADNDREDILLSFKDDILRELGSLKRDVEKIKNLDPSPIPSDGQRLFEQQSQEFFHNETSNDLLQQPRVSFRDATETVPSFDGYNIPLSQFIRACRRAKEIVPPSSERGLTKLLINKLRGRAYYAVEDEPCETIAQLTDALNLTFGRTKSAEMCRGELSTVIHQTDEHMVDYITRVKELRSALLDAERRTRGNLDPHVILDVDVLTARSFCEGLTLNFRSLMGPEHYSRPFEAFAKAKALASREEQDGERRSMRQPQAPPMRRPLAQSTPERRDPGPRYRIETPPRDYGPRNLDFHRQRNDWRDETRFNNGRRDRFANNPPPPSRRDDRPPVQCRYCKNMGHEIQDCRKRQYNNARQGNYYGPPTHPDNPREGPSRSRPVNMIEASAEEQPESGSSNREISPTRQP